MPKKCVWVCVLAYTPTLLLINLTYTLSDQHHSHACVILSISLTLTHTQILTCFSVAMAMNSRIIAELMCTPPPPLWTWYGRGSKCCGDVMVYVRYLNPGYISRKDK